MDPLAFAGAGFEDDVPFPGEDWLDLAREYGPVRCPMPVLNMLVANTQQLVGGDSSNFEGPTNHAYLPFPPYNLHGSTAMSSQYLGATFAAGQSNGAQAGAGNSLLGLNVTADEFVPHRDASRAHDRGYPINYGRQGGRNRTLDPKGMQRGASPPFPAQNISAGFDTGWSSGSSTGIASSGPQTPPRRLMSNDPAISSRTSTSSLYRQINSFMTPSPSSQQSFRGLAGTGPSRVQSADEPWRNWQGNQNYPTRSLSQQNGQVRPTVASTGQRPDRSAATGPAQLPSTNMLETLPAPSRRAPHWEPAYSLGDRTIVHRQTLEVPTQFQENNPNVRQAPPSTTSRSCEHPGCRCKRQFDSDAEYR